MGRDANYIEQATYEEWDHSKHYDMVASWWRGHESDPPPPGLLPCYGVVIYDSRPEPRCAGWFSYDPVNQVAHLDWFVANPEIPLCLKYGLALFQCLRSWANSLQATVIFCQCPDPRMADAAQRAGFTETNTNVTALAMLLTEVD